MENHLSRLRSDALEIATEAIQQMHPEILMKQALKDIKSTQKMILISIGKAAWTMAKAASNILGNSIQNGIVITKYQHSEGAIGNLKIREAGHPFPDENSLKATQEVLEMVQDLTENNTVLLLISGGASALFEQPLPGVGLQDIISITQKLMNSGADIYELNTVRKHLSTVKGGRFAQIISPAKIISFVLSDVIGDDLAVIASGPVYSDKSTSEDALQILEKYQINISEKIRNAILIETPKTLPEIETTIIGNVGDLCEKAVEISKRIGYKPIIIAKDMQCEAKLAAENLIDDFNKIRTTEKEPFALILGGETVVKIHGTGKGGRNQEVALIASRLISGIENMAVLVIASDGTDGPTEAAGGLVDGTSWQRMQQVGIDPENAVQNNDSYHALQTVGDLVFTGPTGTNVNDLIIILSG
ncbi:MAG: glycerate kinase [Candidatus Cloacimonadales bacterium]|nr:glycerate kinase [Candidatus Cloacimonadales bacterium]